MSHLRLTTGQGHSAQTEGVMAWRLLYWSLNQHHAAMNLFRSLKKSI